MSDLISREAVLKEAMARIQYLHDAEDIKDHVKEVIETEPPVEPQEKYAELMKQYKHLRKYASDLETRLSVEQTEWISVKDRLPEKNGEYYVSVRYECEDGTQFDDVTTCYFWKDSGVWNDVDDWLGKIIAWQPITEPSPYKGE